MVRYDNIKRVCSRVMLTLVVLGVAACTQSPRLNSPTTVLAALPGAVTDIVVLTGRVDRLLVTVDRGAGVYWSDDGGVSWNPARKMGDLAGFRLLPLPEAGAVLVATSRGVYRSEDRGATWALAWGTRLGAAALAVDSNGRPLAGGHEEIARGDVSGTRWESARGRITGATILALTVRGPNGPVLAGTNAAGVWETRDAGRTWRSVYPTRAVVSHLLAGEDGPAGIAGPGLLLWSGDAEWPRVVVPPAGSGRPLSLAVSGSAWYAGTESGALLLYANGWQSLDRYPHPVTALRFTGGRLCAGTAGGQVHCRAASEVAGQ